LELWVGIGSPHVTSPKKLKKLHRNKLGKGQSPALARGAQKEGPLGGKRDKTRKKAPPRKENSHEKEGQP